MKKTTLKDFTKLKQGELLKEWSDQYFELYTLKCISHIKNYLRDYLIFEAGASIEPYEKLFYKTNDFIEQLFGLPYTSTSGFGALWVTNTQARAKHGKPIYFRYIAVIETSSTMLDVIMCFEDENEKEHYFTGPDFVQYQEYERLKEKAKRAEQFKKECDEITNNTINVINQYVGKPYGEKTKEKIHEEIKHINNYVYLSNNYLKIDNKHDYKLKRSFYLGYLSKDNKLQQPEQKDKKADFNGVKELNAIISLSSKIKKQAEVLNELLEEARKINNNINILDNAKIDTFNLNLYNLANSKLI